MVGRPVRLSFSHALRQRVPPRPPRRYDREMATAVGDRQRGAGRRAPLLPAARCAARGGISRRVHPMWSVSAGLSPPGDPYRAGGWRLRGRHTLYRAGNPALHGLPRHAVRSGVPDRCPDTPIGGVEGVSSGVAGAATGAMCHLSRHAVPSLRGFVPDRGDRAGDRRHRASGDSHRRMRRMRGVCEGVHHITLIS